VFFISDLNFKGAKSKQYWVIKKTANHLIGGLIFSP